MAEIELKVAVRLICHKRADRAISGPRGRHQDCRVSTLIATSSGDCQGKTFVHADVMGVRGHRRVVALHICHGIS